MPNELFDFDEFSRQVAEAFDTALETIGKFNLAVFGDSGVGKSTLVNAVFGIELAGTGIGNHQTTNVRLYRKNEDDLLGIYDTPGFEIGQGDLSMLISEVKGIVERSRQGPLAARIHAVWFVVNHHSTRFLDSHADAVRALHDLGLPVFIVLTRVSKLGDRIDPAALTLMQHITERGLPIAGRKIFLVNSVETVELSGTIYPVHGLQELLDATVETIPEAVRTAAIAAQRLDFSRQRVLSERAIKVAVGAAFGTQLMPIGVDMAGFTLALAGMMATISVLYGVPVDKAALINLSWKVFLGGNAAKQGAGWLAEEVAKRSAEKAAKKAGQAAAKQGAKLIPGVNLVVAAVSTAVAAPMMWAVGRSWMEVCEYMRTHPEEVVNERESSYIELFLKCYRERMTDRRPTWLSRFKRD
ncbi:GTPase RsgA [Streptomyces sp. NPDC088732]|uniref:GTPase RsgA n=1 Tax=Streptomyces sp. NPDC088732 TaxID=3365879 RepID=UPI00381EA087